MAESRIAIDDIMEAATDGVLRALEARKVNGPEFTRGAGFYVRIDLTAGGWPLPNPVELGGLRAGGLQAGG